MANRQTKRLTVSLALDEFDAVYAAVDAGAARSVNAFLRDAVRAALIRHANAAKAPAPAAASVAGRDGRQRVSITPLSDTKENEGRIAGQRPVDVSKPSRTVLNAERKSAGQSLMR